MFYVSQLLEHAETKTYTTKGGITIKRTKNPVELHVITEALPKQLDSGKGALFSSSFEYTGRYTRWDVGFINPPIEVSTRESFFVIKALNKRGTTMLQAFVQPLENHPHIRNLNIHSEEISGEIRRPFDQNDIDESERTKQPSVFDVVRLIQNQFYSKEDAFLGLYGAFGFDLIYQFENMSYAKQRPIDHCDLKLYLPDEIFVVDRKQTESYCIQYDFIVDGELTEGYQRQEVVITQKERVVEDFNWVYPKGDYADIVRQALPAFQQGDLFEVVPSQVIKKQISCPPSEVYKNLKEQNPSPYGFMINLGTDHLIGASPEMYVRVDGNTVETCPISGTIKRGENSIEDAENIRKLLNSKKDEAELTMCTDVDRNDKSRICVPGSVKVMGRRQIEMYSKLFHTVDHIIGELRPEFDGIDAFITHMWAVTVTGAPKLAAVKWIEDHEETPREWYGGAVGWIAFNGDINTGLTLRTAKIRNNVAEMRVGATLLHASVPEEEEEETLIKVKALQLALEKKSPKNNKTIDIYLPGKNRHILLVDHEDSFVHTLGNYFKQTGASVLTLRADHARKLLMKGKVFDLVVLSPGPSRPNAFRMRETIDLCLQQNIPLFGVCLGFQGIAEYFGGTLNVLSKPSHGERTAIDILEPMPLFNRFQTQQMEVGRYHSLYVETLPDCLKSMAQTKDGILMAFKHESLPIYGVQFHPESILSIHDGQGYKLICNLMKSL